jgi:hypothetical protein
VASVELIVARLWRLDEAGQEGIVDTVLRIDKRFKVVYEAGTV